MKSKSVLAFLTDLKESALSDWQRTISEALTECKQARKPLGKQFRDQWKHSSRWNMRPLALTKIVGVSRWSCFLGGKGSAVSWPESSCFAEAFWSALCCLCFEMPMLLFSSVPPVSSDLLRSRDWGRLSITSHRGGSDEDCYCQQAPRDRGPLVLKENSPASWVYCSFLRIRCLPKW